MVTFFLFITVCSSFLGFFVTALSEVSYFLASVCTGADPGEGGDGGRVITPPPPNKAKKKRSAITIRSNVITRHSSVLYTRRV
jgi:hypothetical protein